jgi:hypothetical protein
VTGWKDSQLLKFFSFLLIKTNKPMKSKEEILQRCAEEKFGVTTFEGAGRVRYMVHDHDYVLKAMDEHAKEVAIEFIDWQWDNGWVRCYYDGGFHGYYQPSNPEADEITRDQLFSLFISQQEK